MSVQTVLSHGILHGLTEGFSSVVTAAKQVTNELGPIEVPPTEALIKLHIRGWIDDATLSQVAAKNGVSIDLAAPTLGEGGATSYDEYKRLWNTVYAAECEIPQPVEMREISNRQFLSDERYDRILRRYGYKDSTYRAWVGNLRYDIPGPADLVRFSVRHVWEPDLLAKIGYDKEFPGAIIDVWHAMKGLDYPLFAGGPFAEQLDRVGGAGYAARLSEQYAALGISDPTWAKAYWWSHWVLPSPGQFFDMLIRLDPLRDRSFDSPEMLGKEFTLEDYRLGLRANDYPPKYRDLLAAINRPIVGIRFLRSFVATDVYGYQDIIEWARRWGYSPRDQRDVANNIWATVKEKKQKAAACKGCATCDQAFEVGIISEEDLAGCYVGYGADPADAERMAKLADQKLLVKRGKEFVASVRRRFLKGSISEQDAFNLLANWGIALKRVGWYLDDWRQEFESGRKELSAAQAVKYACQGLISIEDLSFRLSNLGYPQADREALIREAAYCAVNLAAQEQAKLARKDRQAKADAYTAARRARQSLVEAQRYLASHGTPKQLHDWFCSGTIGEPEIYTRLNALGWPDVDIGRFLSDCKSGRKPTGAGLGGEPVVAPLVPPTPEATEIEGLP